MKSIIAAGLLLGCAQGAIAGPYANVEANSNFTGSDYEQTTTEAHVGYEGNNWYIQGGPAVVQPDNGASSVELSGKIGGSYPITEPLSVYGEVSFLTGDENTYATKVGAKYLF